MGTSIRQQSWTWESQQDPSPFEVEPKQQPHPVPTVSLRHLGQNDLVPAKSNELQDGHRMFHHAQLFRDRVYGAKEWRAHTSWRRFLPQPILSLIVLAGLFYPVGWVMLVGIGCGIYQDVVRDQDWPNLDDLNLSPTYNTISFALSLLLVFKTNTSHARWWEARCAWGDVYTNMRSLLRKAMNYSPNATLAQRQMFVRWVVAAPYIMRSHLMDYIPGSIDLSDLLTEMEITWLQNQRHQCIAATQVIGQLAREMVPDSILVQDMSLDLSKYLANMGACERIQRTPIPMPYLRHTVRFLMVYITFLPLALWANLGWATLPTASLIAFLLSGIENIGIRIENPMLVLPMAAFCFTIQSNVLDMSKTWRSAQQEDLSIWINNVLKGSQPMWQTQHKQSEQGAESDSFRPCSGTVADPTTELRLGKMLDTLVNGNVRSNSVNQRRNSTSSPQEEGGANFTADQQRSSILRPSAVST